MDEDEEGEGQVMKKGRVGKKERQNKHNKLRRFWLLFSEVKVNLAFFFFSGTVLILRLLMG